MKSWIDLAVVIGPVLVGVAGVLAYFKRKPASKMDDAATNKIRVESNLLEKSIREESINLLKSMIETQTVIIENLRTEVRDLKKDIGLIKVNHNALLDENLELKRKIKEYKRNPSYINN